MIARTLERSPARRRRRNAAGGNLPAAHIRCGAGHVSVRQKDRRAGAARRQRRRNRASFVRGRNRRCRRRDAAAARFEDYVGKRQVVDNLKIAIEAAKRRGEPLDHVLFSGPPGLGKTTLAGLIAREWAARCGPTSGPTLEKPKDLVGILTALESGDMLFIDEIHRLGSVVEEYLYPAMEDFQIDFLVDQRRLRENVQASVQAFHARGCDDAGRDALGAAARTLRHHAPPRLLCRARTGADRRCEARRCSTSRSTPTAPRRSPSAAAARRASPTGCCGACAISPKCGPRRRHRRSGRRRGAGARRRRRTGARPARPRLSSTIAVQYGGGPVGIKAVAATLTEDVETLEDVVEPYLLKTGFVQRTASGRKSDRERVRAPGEGHPPPAAPGATPLIGRRTFLGSRGGRADGCVAGGPCRWPPAASTSGTPPPPLRRSSRSRPAPRSTNPCGCSSLRGPASTRSCRAARSSTQRYPGTYAIVPLPSGSHGLVSTVDLEAYVCGVVPVEAGRGWPAAALQAQAIAARTYAVTRRSARRTYDVVAERGRSEATAGRARNRPETRTPRSPLAAGQVLAYGRRVGDGSSTASSCGGHTADAASGRWANVGAPVLARRRRPVLRRARPEYRWRVDAGCRRVLPRARGPRLRTIEGLVEAIAVAGPTTAGRAATLTRVPAARGSASASLVEGAAARSERRHAEPLRVIGGTSAEDQRRPRRWIAIEGAGRGHGVGMCQWGARGSGAGQETFRALTILSFYFPGTVVRHG